MGMPPCDHFPMSSQLPPLQLGQLRKVGSVESTCRDTF